MAGSVQGAPACGGAPASSGPPRAVGWHDEPAAEERMSSEESTTVDVGSWLGTLARNWWVVLGLVVLGIVAGAAVTLAQPKEYTATSSVYIGQTTDANGNPMAGLNSNAKAAVQLLGSQELLDEAAQAAGDGMTPGKLRRSTTVETPSQTIKTTSSVVNIVIISVTDTKKARATASANALAEALVARISPGVDEKIALLEEQLAAGKAAMAKAVARGAAAQKALAAVATGGGSTTEKAVTAATYLTIVQAAATQQEALASANQKTELMLLTAKTVEQPRVLHEAALPDSPSGPDMTMNVAAGALAGLVIGVIAAFVRERLRRRPAAA
jgi:succinoglycan biosynthesis transport protein ExoP